MTFVAASFGILVLFVTHYNIIDNVARCTHYTMTMQNNQSVILNSSDFAHMVLVPFRHAERRLLYQEPDAVSG